MIGWVFCHDNPANHIRMTVDKFGDGVQHYVGPKFQWFLQIRGAEGVVHHELNAVFMSKFSACGDIGDGDRGVAGVSMYSSWYCSKRFHQFYAAGIHEMLHSKRKKKVIQNTARSAVNASVDTNAPQPKSLVKV
jgi:hypothetical protein